jgi:RNA polymerase sigma factor (sigma-70 family)
MRDDELLRQYLAGSQAAFEELVRRYVDLVYSAALRQARDPHQAQDITQAVFIILSRKADRIGPDVILSGWLLNAARYAAADARKADARRKKHEGKAAQMKSETQNPQPDRWEQVAPELDEALAELGEKVRSALVLSYFEGKSAREVAQRLGISEEAARQRVCRGVEQLRHIFAQRGLTLSAMSLSGLIVANAVSAAPAPVAAGVVGGLHAAAGVSIAKGAMATMAAAKLKIAAALILAASLAGGTSLVVVKALAARHPVPRISPQTIAPLPDALAQAKPIPVQPDLPPAVLDAPKEETISGQLLGIDGKPLAGEKVYRIAPGQSIAIYSENRALARIPSGMTDDQGKFAVPWSGPRCTLFCRTEDGIAAVRGKQFAQTHQIKLEQWGRIEGVMKIGAAPGAKQTVMFSRWPSADDTLGMALTHDLQIQTDEQGHFVLPKACPGEIMMCQANTKGPWMMSHFVALIVEPGKTHQVQIGGTGRPVVGKAVLPPNTPNATFKVDRTHFHELMLRKTDLVSMAISDNWAEMDADARTEYTEKWNKTPEGRAYKPWMFPWQVAIAPDGSYRIEDVPPGKYDLSVRTFLLDKRSNFAEDTSTGRMEVVVPPMKETRADQPLALADLKLEASKHILNGDAAPEFEFKNFDGNSVKLSDFQGKYVLLMIWCIDPEVGVSEMPNWLEAYRRWGDDPHLVMLGLNTDFFTEKAHKYALDKALPWVNLDAAGKWEILGKLEIGSGSTMLIGPDGRIVEKRLMGKNIVKALDEELGKK